MKPTLQPFLGKVPDIAKYAQILDDSQIQDVDYTQAVFELAHEKGLGLVPEGGRPGDVLRNYSSRKAVEGLASNLKLDAQEIAARAAEYRGGRQAENAPYFMDTLEVFKHLKPRDKDPILAAQASARTANIVQEIQAGNSQLSLDEALGSMRDPRPEEGEYLKASQHTQQVAQVLAAAVKENPSLALNDDVKRAFTALELLAGQGFKKASEQAKDFNMYSAWDLMKDARATQRDEVNVMSKLASTSTLVSKVEEGMKAVAAAQSDPSKAQAILGTMAAKKQEMKGFKVFGSLVLPSFAMTKKSMSFVEQVTQGRNDPDKGGRNF